MILSVLQKLEQDASAARTGPMPDPSTEQENTENEEEAATSDFNMMFDPNAADGQSMPVEQNASALTEEQGQENAAGNDD